MTWEMVAMVVAMQSTALICISGVAAAVRRIADALESIREESKRQFDLERQYPGRRL